MWASIIAVIFLCLEIVALYCSWRAIRFARTPQGSVGWVVFLISAPYIAVPVYLFLGHHKYNGYINARRDSHKVREEMDEWAKTNAAERLPSDYDYSVFERIAYLPATRGNNMDLLIGGKATFDALYQAIDNAEKYILIQFYIVKDDEVGRALQDRLLSAAKRGVKVRMLVDGVGSLKLPQSYIQTLTDGGVEIIDPKKVRGPKTRFQLNFRNHRKTLVIDGTTGFTGGVNVGKEYMGLDPNFGDWRDTHARFHGPIVSQLQLIFAEDWYWVTDKIIADDLNWESSLSDKNQTALLVPSGPGDDLDTGSVMFFSAITAAKKRIWLASPYFVPDTVILAALKQAALRGVDVRILIPEVIDHKIPWLAAFAYFDEVVEAGCQIWRYQTDFMHQKVFLVDEEIAAVGTTNLDNRSFRLNFETMALIFDKNAVKDIEQMLLKDFDQSIRMTKKLDQQRSKIRIGAPIARLFSPLL
ncbi:MAG: cardiolipin synthase [Roseibium sp.]